MKKIIIFMLAASTGALIGCSSENDNGSSPSKPSEPTWRCTVGEREQCYTGPAGTQGKGICVAGHKDCVDDGDGSHWTDCIDEVTPDYSYPCDANEPDRDNDCNGIADSKQDEDGDGLTVCDRYGRRLDCCDNDKQCITPGARSFKRSKFKDCIGDFIDGDCNGVIDDGDTECTDEDIRIARAERCGDGMLQSLENCDEGLNGKGGTGEYNGCNEDCTWASYCGDGNVDKENGEECDDGLGRIMVGNESRGGGTGAYNKTSVTCGPDCKFSKSGYCGDGIINGDEQCDNGKDKNTGEYEGCNPDCTFGPYCGDGIINGNEVCDDGLGHIVDTNLSIVGGGTGAYGGVACLPDCSGRSSYCGDGIIDPGEICDEGSNNTESTYGTCQKNTCVWNSICGDGIIDSENGEQCDDGIVTEERSGNTVKLKYVGGDGSYEGCTADCKLAPRCGDGIVNSIFEECDKGKTGNASCSPTCMIEPGYECKNNDCHQLKCGNNVIDHGEECDDKKDAAYCIGCVAKSGYVCKNSVPACPTNIPGKYCAVSGVECIKISDLYGDGIVSKGFEECDDGNTIDYDGCTRGNVDPGYTCLTPGARCYARTCGDGILAYGEECDDGNANSNDGCSNRCKLEEGFRCETVGKKSVCTKGNGCGDGIVQHGEECDDGGQNGGCSSTCKIEPGYECPSTGGTCRRVTCGNGVVNQSAGYNTYEQCDLGSNNGKTGSGCTSQCRIAQGYHCNATGTQCYSGVCGDGNIDIGEECDDGNLISGDGCNAACKIETVFEQTVDGSYKPICGDGITVWDAGEECDDGNLVSGDGCSAQCTIETGWHCTEHSDKYPDKIQLPVTYRDFRAYFTTYSSDNKGTKNTKCANAKNSTAVDGCINDSMASTYGGNFSAQAGHPDFERMNVNADGAGLVKSILGSDGLPVWQQDTKKTGITAKSFHMWYRDYPGINKTIKQNLTLTLTNATNGTYKFESSAFFPLDGKGYGNETVNNANDHNFHFTSHIKTYFKFRGNNETLDFTGDDDVFVFVNGIQAIDLGGCHSATNKSFKLDSTTQKKTVNNQTYTYKYNSKYDLYENGIYAINFFQAERKTSGSNFKLTLAGFMDMGPSTCNTVCGDGILAGYEQCESTDANGNLLAISQGGALRNGCTQNCTNSSCGNGQLDEWEECDYVGTNPKYKNASYNGNFSCNANTCRVQYCGDGIADLLLGEECDAGSKNGGAECTKNCELPRCGDGIITRELGEECDDGPNNQAGAYGEGKCTNECKKASYCGDGTVDSGEECDLGRANKAGAYGKGTCTTDCKWGGYCGDGVKDAREKCDNGQANNDTLYNGCTTDCTFGPRCGDGVVNGSEQCDNGAANSEFVYGKNGCRPDCTLAPYCGDGIINGPEKREYCDNGDSNDAAAYGENSCTNNCMKGARCGDGVVNGSEQCDNGNANSDNAYNGCTTNCEFGPRCGDGIINGNEFCDNGSRNSDSIYGADECKTNCTRAPYCGDGLLNGTAEHPELCDLGKDNNIGNYNGCTSDCQLGPHCGDGIIQPEDGEECDPMQEGEMYCTSTCRKIQL